MSGATATPPSTPVLRVKRRRSQSPAGALLLHLSAKRRKQQDDLNLGSDKSPSPKKEAVFKFTATIESNDHDSLKSALGKAAKEDRLKITDPKLVKRLAKSKESPTKKKVDTPGSEKRYKIISNKRGIDVDHEKEESERLFKLVDVIKTEDLCTDKNDQNKKVNSTEAVDQITCNGVPLVKLAEEEYVYDVYTMQNDAFSSTESDHSIMEDFDANDIVDISWLDCRDLQDDPEEVYRTMIEDSDSNDEDHWKNDYPDEDEFSDDDADFYNENPDDDLDLDFDKFHLRHGNREIASSASENESSEDEEGFIHSTTAGFEQDANLHGTSYAKWKRKMLKEMGEEEGDHDEEDDINEVDEF